MKITREVRRAEMTGGICTQCSGEAKLYFVLTFDRRNRNGKKLRTSVTRRLCEPHGREYMVRYGMTF